jgi:carotenoid cleavage dioxygenase-like enzyme
VYAWEPEKGVHIGIMPRRGTVADMRWFKGDPAYVFHPMNAHSNGDVVTCDDCEFEEAPLFPRPDGTPGDPNKAVPRLTRWTFDLGKNSADYKWERLNDIACEFPRLDERSAGSIIATLHGVRYAARIGRRVQRHGRIDHRTASSMCDVGAGARPTSRFRAEVGVVGGGCRLSARERLRRRAQSQPSGDPRCRTRN